MDTINELMSALLTLTSAGLVVRLVICFIRIAVGDESALAENKRHIKTTLVWLAIALSITGLQAAITAAYGL